MMAQQVTDASEPTTAGTPFASKTFADASAAADGAGGMAINRAVIKKADLEEDGNGAYHGWRAPDDVKNKHAPLKARLSPSDAWLQAMSGRVKLTARSAVSPQHPQPAPWPSWDTAKGIADKERWLEEAAAKSSERKAAAASSSSDKNANAWWAAGEYDPPLPPK